MEFNEQNWHECLESLGFTVQKNPNGANCYDIYDEKGIPRWQYDTIGQQKKLYYFFCGCVYMKIHMGNY